MARFAKSHRECHLENGKSSEIVRELLKIFAIKQSIKVNVRLME